MLSTLLSHNIAKEIKVHIPDLIIALNNLAWSRWDHDALDMTIKYMDIINLIYFDGRYHSGARSQESRAGY